MIKNKIATKLTLYFLSALAAFTIIISGVFFFLFQAYIVEWSRGEMEGRATRIATYFSEQMTAGDSDNSWERRPARPPRTSSQENSERRERDPRSLRHHDSNNLRSINNLSNSNIWVIDAQRNLSTSNRGEQEQAPLTYSLLPSDGKNMVESVFKGKIHFSRGFTSVIHAPTLTVGVPIRDDQGDILGVVLLHRPMEGITNLFEHSLRLLGGSILIALILSFLVAIKLAYSFTNPLNKMKDTALKLADGDYEAKNNLTIANEIGQLSNAMDLMSERLHQASKEKEKLDRFKNNFIVNISHELRTPITVIRGSLEALVDKVVSKPEQMEEYHQQMLKEAILLQRLTGDLLEISRLQNEDFPMVKEKINLWDPLDDAIRSAKSLGKDKNISIDIERESSPKIFSGDYGRLRQLFLIILDNAVKFSPENGRIHVIQTGNTIHIRDYGKGISPEDLPYIFDRFYQSSLGATDLGTGLGLAIAKQIAARHDITLTAASIPDEPGAQFELEFPEKLKAY